MDPDLTPYELARVREIAAWKSERPSLINQVVDGVCGPVARLVCRVIPRAQVEMLIRKAENIALRREKLEAIATRAGVADVAELRNRPLEFCDRLAAEVEDEDGREAIIEGFAQGYGGFIIGSIVVPLEIINALRSISRIGHCYGYRLDRERDKGLIVDLLGLSTLEDPVLRQQYLAALHANWESQAPEPQSAELVDTWKQGQIRNEVLTSVPVVGSAVSFIVQYEFSRSVDVTARRFFQERWLRDNGKVTEIAPDPNSHRRKTLSEVGDALNQTAYILGSAVGFGATFPCLLLASLIGQRDYAAVRGLRDGARSAARDSAQFRMGWRASVDQVFASPAAALTPQPVPD